MKKRKTIHDLAYAQALVKCAVDPVTAWGGGVPQGPSAPAASSTAKPIPSSVSAWGGGVPHGPATTPTQPKPIPSSVTAWGGGVPHGPAIKPTQSQPTPASVTAWGGAPSHGPAGDPNMLLEAGKGFAQGLGTGVSNVLSAPLNFGRGLANAGAGAIGGLALAVPQGLARAYEGAMGINDGSASAMWDAAAKPFDDAVMAGVSDAANSFGQYVGLRGAPKAVADMRAQQNAALPAGQRNLHNLSNTGADIATSMLAVPPIFRAATGALKQTQNLPGAVGQVARAVAPGAKLWANAGGLAVGKAAPGARGVSPFLNNVLGGGGGIVVNTAANYAARGADDALGTNIASNPLLFPAANLGMGFAESSIPAPSDGTDAAATTDPHIEAAYPVQGVINQARRGDNTDYAMTDAMRQDPAIINRMQYGALPRDAATQFVQQSRGVSPAEQAATIAAISQNAPDSGISYNDMSADMGYPVSEAPQSTATPAAGQQTAPGSSLARGEDPFGDEAGPAKPWTPPANMTPEQETAINDAQTAVANAPETVRAAVAAAATDPNDKKAKAAVDEAATQNLVNEVTSDPAAAAEGAEGFGARIGKAMEWYGNQDPMTQGLLALGLTTGAIGLISSMGGGGMGSFLMTLLGLGGAGGLAAMNGAFGEEPAKLVGNLFNQVGGMGANALAGIGGMFGGAENSAAPAAEQAVQPGADNATSYNAEVSKMPLLPTAANPTQSRIADAPARQQTTASAPLPPLTANNITQLVSQDPNGVFAAARKSDVSTQKTLLNHLFDLPEDKMRTLFEALTPENKKTLLENLHGWTGAVGAGTRQNDLQRVRKLFPKAAAARKLALKAARCWEGYEPVPGTKAYSEGSCRPKGSKKTKKEVIQGKKHTEKKSEAPASGHPKIPAAWAQGYRARVQAANSVMQKLLQPKPVNTPNANEVAVVKKAAGPGTGSFTIGRQQRPLNVTYRNAPLTPQEAAQIQAIFATHGGKNSVYTRSMATAQTPEAVRKVLEGYGRSNYGKNDALSNAVAGVLKGSNVPHSAMDGAIPAALPIAAPNNATPAAAPNKPATAQIPRPMPARPGPCPNGRCPLPSSPRPPVARPKMRQMPPQTTKTTPATPTDSAYAAWRAQQASPQPNAISATPPQNFLNNKPPR